MTDGTEFVVYSSFGKGGDTLSLDIDPSTHPAWTGGDTKLDGPRRPSRHVSSGSSKASSKSRVCESQRTRRGSPGWRRVPVERRFQGWHGGTVRDFKSYCIKMQKAR